MKTNTQYSLLFCLRLAACICVVTSVLLLVLSYYVKYSFNKHLVQQNVFELNTVTKVVQSELLQHPPINKAAINIFKEKINPIVNSHHHLYVNIYNGDKKLVYRTGPNLLLADASLEWVKLSTKQNTLLWQYRDQAYRLLRTTFISPNGNKYRIIVAMNCLRQEYYVKKWHQAHFIFIISTGIISFLWTLITIHFTHKPVHRLANILKNLTSQQLNYRIPLSKVSPKSIEIAQAFNKMLAHIEDVVKRQRNFATDIAHEIRTPITNLVTQTQIALTQTRTTDDYKEILYSHLEEYERLSKMISDMLFLSQADNRLLTPEWVTINIGDIFTQLFEYYEPLARDKNIRFWLQGSVPPIQGDRLMLSRAIGNLLSNAIRYTPNDQNILVELEQRDPHHIQFIVANPGKKIEAEHLPKLFDRFYRVDRSRQRNDGGSGIGLAIVKSIIETFAGTIRVESDEVSTRFIVSLPI